MKIKDILNHDERDFFCIEILFVASTKYVITFFNKTIDDNANDIVSFRWKKIDNKVYNDVSSTLFRNKQ